MKAKRSVTTMKKAVHIFSDGARRNGLISPSNEVQICVTKTTLKQDLAHLANGLKSVQTSELIIYGESPGRNIDNLVRATLSNRFIDKVQFVAVEFSSSFLCPLRDRFTVVVVEQCKVDPLPDEVSFVLAPNDG